MKIKDVFKAVGIFLLCVILIALIISATIMLNTYLERITATNDWAFLISFISAIFIIAIVIVCTMLIIEILD